VCVCVCVCVCEGEGGERERERDGIKFLRVQKFLSFHRMENVMRMNAITSFSPQRDAAGQK